MSEKQSNKGLNTGRIGRLQGNGVKRKLEVYTIEKKLPGYIKCGEW